MYADTCMHMVRCMLAHAHTHTCLLHTSTLHAHTWMHVHTCLLAHLHCRGSHLSSKSRISAKTEFPNQLGKIPSAKKNYSPQKTKSELLFSLRNSSRWWKQMKFHWDRVRYQHMQDARLDRRHFPLFLPCGEPLNVFLLILVRPKEMSSGYRYTWCSACQRHR